MFSKGEYIIYGTKGVCKVMDITTIQREGIPGNRLYYLLMPINSRGSKVFTPVDNDKIVMRSLISREEAEKLIDEMPQIEELSVPSEKLREQSYKDCMRTADCRDYVRILKTLYHRKQTRLAHGKKSTSTDERYMKQAEDALCSELSIQLEIPREKVPDYIDWKLKRVEAEA